MDSDTPVPEPYRSRFRDYLRSRLNNADTAKPSAPRDDVFLIADMLLTERPDLARLFSDRIDAVTAQPKNTVPIVNQQNASESITDENGNVYRSTFEGAPFSSTETRKSLEDAVRKIKRMRQPCPHCSADRLCCRTSIRCGERGQYAARESQRQRMLPHRCNYDPVLAATHAILVGLAEPDQRRVQSIAADVLGMSPSRILTAASGQKTIDLVNTCKIDMRRCGLVIAAIRLPDMTAFDLVNELYRRNCDTNVILVQPTNAQQVPKPRAYTGDVDIAPGEPLVRSTIPSPIPSNHLGTILRSLHIKTII